MIKHHSTTLRLLLLFFEISFSSGLFRNARDYSSKSSMISLCFLHYSSLHPSLSKYPPHHPWPSSLHASIFSRRLLPSAAFHSRGAVSLLPFVMWSFSVMFYSAESKNGGHPMGLRFSALLRFSLKGLTLFIPNPHSSTLYSYSSNIRKVSIKAMASSQCYLSNDVQTPLLDSILPPRMYVEVLSNHLRQRMAQGQGKSQCQ